MITLPNLIFLFLCFTIGYGFWHNARFKDIALKHTRDYCATHSLQLLDDSILIRKLWPYRTSGGWLGLERTYEFEFTATGDRRQRGWLTLRGYRLHLLQVPPYPIN